MKRTLVALIVLEAACATPSTGITTGATAKPREVASAPPSAACVAARSLRDEATALDRDGHATLALARIDEANAACPTERASSAALESKLLADNSKCAAVRALPADGPGVKGARASCAALEAPSIGTAASMRAKMREAYGAERTKDWPRAKSLYLAAWTELHPNPRALEAAARMATLAGDAPESRRLRDRALIEAERDENAVAEIAERVRVVRGDVHLAGTTLLVASDGNVVARDTSTGALRVLLSVKAGQTRLSPGGTIAVTTAGTYATETATLSVWDLLTGELLFKVPGSGFTVSADDTRVLVRDQPTENDAVTHVRILDAATGAIVAKTEGSFANDAMFFAPDASHVVFDVTSATMGEQIFRQWSLEKSAFTNVKLATTMGTAAVSLNGQYVTWLEQTNDGAPLHVLDLVSGKEIAQWPGKFHSVSALAVSSDGATVATGSVSSLRLWNVAQKKQTFKDATGYGSAGTDSSMQDQFAFSEDGKTMVLGGRGLPTAWDVATGTMKPLVTEQPRVRVLRVARGPDAVAIVAEDEVRILPTSGEARTVCRGLETPYSGIIGPTAVAFSSSGKSFACAMSDGWVHLFDAATWKETAVVKRGAKSPMDRPVDLFFSADEKTLGVASDTGWILYDASTASVASRFSFRHPGVALAPRHARFDDGSFAVRAWNGAVALFDKNGAFVRDVKLDVASPITALDAFSDDGSTYAFAVGKTLHVIDLASGAARTVELPAAPKTLSLARDGKTMITTAGDKTVSLVSGATVTALGAKGANAWIAGKSALVALADDTIAVFGVDGNAGPELELDPNGLVARRGDAFEIRGTPEVECVVGKTFLERETCADRAKTGLVAAWIQSTMTK